MNNLTKIESNKSPEELIKTIKQEANRFNFIIREIFDMNKEFQHHHIETDKDFIFYSIMICNPKKAYKSILKNPIRGAILLPPKQITIYKEKNKENTTIAYLDLDKEFIKTMLPEDTQFQEGLEQSCNNIIKLINLIK